MKKHFWEAEPGQLLIAAGAAIVGAAAAAWLLDVNRIVGIILFILGAVAGTAASTVLSRSPRWSALRSYPPRPGQSTPDAQHHSPQSETSHPGLSETPKEADHNAPRRAKAWWKNPSAVARPPTNSSNEVLNQPAADRPTADGPGETRRPRNRNVAQRPAVPLGPSERIAQCPRCACFHLSTLRAEPHFLFQCKECAHQWEWRPGTPWPVTQRLSRQLFTGHGERVEACQHTNSWRFDV